MEIDLQRSEYGYGKLERTDLKPSPFDQFTAWFQQACKANVLEPNAMSLATAGKDGRTHVRTVLLKSYDERGFVFFTNLDSQKSRHIKENPNAALLFPWLALQRQVIVAGRVKAASDAEAQEYFAGRPRGSQLGAWVSEQQSATVASREGLEAKLQEMERKFAGGEVPMPPWWGGFRVMPREIEFWQGRLNRLHDRFLYSLQKDGSWTIERLSP